MKTEDIIKMVLASCGPGKVDAWDNGFWILAQEEIERFAALVAALVAAHEREECARVCEEYAEEAFNTSSTNAALELRNKIRERGKQ